MQQGLQTLKLRPFVLLAVAALLVAATRGSAANAMVLGAGFGFGLAVGGWIPASRRGPAPVLFVLILAGLLPATIWIINQSSAHVLNGFLAACGAGVGVVVRISFRDSRQRAFGAREFFIFLGGVGALLGATVAREHIVPLALIPLAIAAAISLATRWSFWRQ